MAILYILCRKSKPEDVRYVGITKHDDIQRRLRAHLDKAGRVNRPVCDWLNKYDDVIITKIEGDLTWDEACNKEIDLIKKLRDEGFRLLNMTNGGDGSLGIKQSEETKRKRSESLKGHIVSEETRRKISEKNRGSKRTEEAKKKMSESAKNKIFSKEHKENISKSLLGRDVSPETREKIAKAQRGRPLSEEHVAKLRIAQQKRWKKYREERGIT